MKMCSLAGLEIRPFLQSSTAKKCAGMSKKITSHSDELANFRPSRTKVISRNNCFFSGMAVSLTCQCKLILSVTQILVTAPM